MREPVSVPELVIGEPEIVNPVGRARPTDVTVPPPPLPPWQADRPMVPFADVERQGLVDDARLLN